MSLTIKDLVVKGSLEALERLKSTLPAKPSPLLVKAINNASEIIEGIRKIFNVIKCLYNKGIIKAEEGIIRLGCGNWRVVITNNSVILSRTDPSYFVILNMQTNTLSIKSKDLEVKLEGNILHVIKGQSIMELMLNNVSDLNEKSVTFNALSRHVKALISTVYDKLLKCLKVMTVECELE